MRVLVTGSSGRIGAAICARLRSTHQVIGLDSRPGPATDVVGDILDADAMRHALRGVEAVVHTAALHAPHVGTYSDALFDAVNVQATGALAMLAVDEGIRRFVFTSTTALYGAGALPGAAATWVDEDLAPNPLTIYHRSKLAAEALLETLAARHDLSVTVLRMSRCFPEPVPLMAVYRLHRGIDARDVADAHALALERSVPGLHRYVISGETPFVREDTEQLGLDAPAVLRRRAPALVQAFAQRGWPLPASIDRVYSPARAMRELGWQPRHGFTEVLAD